jgi:hypothetical protein
LWPSDTRWQGVHTAAQRHRGRWVRRPIGRDLFVWSAHWLLQVLWLRLIWSLWTLMMCINVFASRSPLCCKLLLSAGVPVDTINSRGSLLHLAITIDHDKVMKGPAGVCCWCKSQLSFISDLIHWWFNTIRMTFL